MVTWVVAIVRIIECFDPPGVRFPLNALRYRRNFCSTSQAYSYAQIRPMELDRANFIDTGAKSIASSDSTFLFPSLDGEGDISDSKSDAGGKTRKSFHLGAAA